MFAGEYRRIQKSAITMQFDPRTVQLDLRLRFQRCREGDLVRVDCGECVRVQIPLVAVDDEVQLVVEQLSTRMDGR